MEWLKEHLGETLYGQVAEKLKGNDQVKLANLATGEYVQKGKFAAMEAAKKAAESQLSERDKQLEALKKEAGDNESLKEKITQLTAENQKAKEAQEAMQLDFALDARLLREGAVNVKAVKALLDRDKIRKDGEKIVGLDEQISTLKEAEKWAFKGTQVAGSGGNPPPAPENEKPTGPKGIVLM
jgi:predicted Zn-dependent protease